MLTINEAVTLAASGVKDPEADGVQKFDFDNPVIWREFVCAMRMALKRCKRGKIGLDDVATHNVQLLHDVICTNSIYKKAVQNAKRHKPEDKIWFSQPLIEHSQVYASLISVYKGHPMPLHDHPKANGFTLVIEGRIQISRYNTIQTVKSSENHVALSRISERVLSLGEVDILTEDRGNIHGMRSLSQRSLVLDILIPPNPEEPRNWFVPPGNNMINASHILATRVSAEHFILDR